MEKCYNCGKTEAQVRLFDGFSVTDSVKICERCSLIAGIPIIKRPSASQLKSSEQPFSVRNRLTRMAHLPAEEKREKSAYDQLKELSENPSLEQPEDLVFQLVDNFHWIIQTERRRKGLTVKQLADSIRESENAIKLLEKGIVPNRSIDLIRGLEQFLKVKLIKRDALDRIQEDKIRKQQQEIKAILPKPANTSAILGPTAGSRAASSVSLNERDEPKSLRPRPPFSPKKDRDYEIRDLQRQSEKIEKDFAFDHKSREQVGNEQVEDMGREDTNKIKNKLYGNAAKANKTPSIYDLMKKKEERDKTSFTGKDIQIVNDSREKQEIDM